MCGKLKLTLFQNPKKTTDAALHLLHSTNKTVLVRIGNLCFNGSVEGGCTFHEDLETMIEVDLSLGSPRVTAQDITDIADDLGWSHKSGSRWVFNARVGSRPHGELVKALTGHLDIVGMTLNYAGTCAINPYQVVLEVK